MCVLLITRLLRGVGRWARKPVTVVTPTDRPKSVRNCCLIELFCGIVCVVTLPLWHFCWYRGFCHRTGSDLLLFVFSETVEWKSTKFDRNLSNPLPNLCFWADRKTKNAALASDWPRHFWLLLWNCWTEFNETWQEASSQHPIPSLCFGADRKPRWPPWPLIGRDPFYFFSATTEQNSTKLERNNISTFSTNFVYLGPIGKQRLLPWPLILWDI